MVRETACDCCAALGFVVMLGVMCLAPWVVVYVVRSGMLGWIAAVVAGLFVQAKLGDLWDASERIEGAWLRHLLRKTAGFAFAAYSLLLFGGILLSVVS